jgi:asparagine synthase (glutamine-hydrolysing)
LSDLLIAAGIKLDTESFAARLSWTPQTKSWSGKLGWLDWLITRVDASELWAPAYDPQSNVRALLGGRFAPEEAEWKLAEGLPYEGGLACRIVINRWLNGGARAVQAINGGALIAVIDERERTLHAWTDRMGFYPAFMWTGGGFLLCSHPDIAAKALEDAGLPLQFDAVTMAEFLRTGTSVHPYTYWRGIRHMDAGTHFEFHSGATPRLRTSTVYWQPAHLRGEPYLTDRHEIVDRLAAALRSAVRRRTLPRLGKAGVLLSAGADSRTALFGAYDPSAVTCYSVYDEPNAELDGARALALAAGANHKTMARPADYYVEQAPEAVRVSGGMWSVESAHFGGLCGTLAEDKIGVLLTGCYADYLLKGLSYNRTPRKLAGRIVPLYELSSYSHEWYQPFARLEAGWQQATEARLNARYTNANHSILSQSRMEHLRLSPMMREADVSGRLILRRKSGHDFILADHDVLDMACCIAPHQKVSGIAFGMAVEKVAGSRAHHVLNNNYGARVGASEWQRVASFVKASVLRKIRRQGGLQPYERDPNSVATAGSWPYYPRVIKMNGRLRTWRSDMPKEQQELLFEMLGAERRSWSIADWSDRDAHLFLRLYTASLWLSQNSCALTRMEAV